MEQNRAGGGAVQRRLNCIESGNETNVARRGNPACARDAGPKSGLSPPAARQAVSGSDKEY